VLVYIGVILALSAQPYLRAPVEFDNSDKLEHLTEYGGLGWLLARMWAALVPAWTARRRVLMAIGFGAVMATCDELFQRTVPGRQSSVYDALADTLGVSIAQWLWLRWSARGARR
jgi:VanZ family protein